MSRLLLPCAAIAFALPGAAQTYALAGQVIDSRTNTGLPGATVLLKKDTLVVTGCSTNQDGSFQLSKPLGSGYTIEVRSIGYRTKIVLLGYVANPAPLRLLMPGFCPYVYRHGKTPPCIAGHLNEVVPIVYGLPDTKTMEKAKRGKLYLGGCNLTGCDPKYYCLIHKREL
jgi:hypothetical protein